MNYKIKKIKIKYKTGQPRVLITLRWGLYSQQVNKPTMIELVICETSNNPFNFTTYSKSTYKFLLQEMDMLDRQFYEANSMA